MNGTITKILQAFSFLMMGISVILVIMFYVKNSGIPADADFQTQMTEFGASLEYYMVWTYILLFIAAIGAVCSPIINIVSNPKGAVKTLIALVAFAVVIFIAYSVSDSTPLSIPGYTGSDNVPSMIKFAGTGLITMYVMLAAAVASIFYIEIAKIFK